MKNIWIYDIETYPNFFLICFYNIESKEWKVFEISDRKDEFEVLREFLFSKDLMLIGFNNINFDYPVLHKTILTSKNSWDANEIFQEAKNVINEEYSSIHDFEVLIPQLDLYKIWHYDNKNKATSLKWLEFAMRSEDVRDLPYEVGSLLNDEQKDEVISYCKHDVSETYKFYLNSLKHIELRKFYTDLEGINMMNASEIRMSKDIFGKYLAKSMGISVYQLSKMRTYRSEIDIKDIVFDYISFNDPINQQVLNQFNDFKWKFNFQTDKAFEGIKFSKNYKNVVREYAEGGLHSFGKAGVYKSDDEYVLIDVDFASYYPHISFKNKLHPAHIPEPIFSKIYEGFYKDRKNYPKSDPRNYVLKIILNGSYGLSKDKYAFLYDPKWQLQVCINGQLLLTKLTELVYEKCIKPVRIIFENTDGAMYLVARSDLDGVKRACEEMETICNIPLETQECKMIVARDVNNYINVIDDNNIKFKGCFEIDRDYHKNHSKRIVPIALAHYFINGVPVKETILNHIKDENLLNKYGFCDNYGIYDFCIGAKMKGQNRLYKRYIDGLKIIDKPIAKMNRYYVSNDGYELIKKLPPLDKHYLTQTDKAPSNQINLFDFVEDVRVEPKDRETNIEAGWKCTLFNKWHEEPYDINYDYYIQECYKIINTFK